MSRTAKIWLTVAASLLLIGCIIFGGAMTMLKWDFRKLSTSKYETNTHEITENYKNISIVSNTADILFVTSEDSTCSVECYEQVKVKHSVSVKDGTLVIEVVDSRKWYEYIGFNFRTPKITVRIPQGDYGALSIKSSTGDIDIPSAFGFNSVDISVSTGDVKCCASSLEAIKISASTGDICVEGLSAGSLELSVSTGEVSASRIACAGEVKVGVSTGKSYLTDVACKSLVSSGSTGNISLTGVIATERFSIERSTGDVRLDGCDAAEIFVKTDTGDVEGSLLSDKVFIVRTDTGKIDVPKTVIGGRCEITTDTGDIKINIKE